MSIKKSSFSNSIFFMDLALQQARKNLGNTKTNPSVGCIIVKNNHIISAGCTEINGRPHAERNAINFCKINPEKSHLYVTLEPCSHYGKTPPCVNLIIKKKIKKVFFSIKDPDQRTFNKSLKKLKKNGIKVEIGTLKEKIRSFYMSYLRYKKYDLPFVTCKLALSKDLYSINKKNKWITNKFSRGRVHLMRSNHDCIMTSSRTILNDDPRLTCRIDGLENRTPSRIILDNKLQMPITSKVAKDGKNYETIIFYNQSNKKQIKLLKKLKIDTYKIDLDEDGNLDLKKTLIKAKNLGFSRIILESGIKLSRNFLKRNLVDDLKLFISNKKLGKNGNGSFKKYLVSFLKNKKVATEKVNLFGEKLISYKLK